MTRAIWLVLLSTAIGMMVLAPTPAEPELVRLPDIRNDFIDWYHETFDAFVAARHAADTKYLDEPYTLRELQSAILTGLLSGYCDMNYELDRMAKRYSPEDYDFSWYTYKVLDEIELAQLVLNPMTNMYDLRKYVRAKACRWFYPYGRWAAEMEAGALERMGFILDARDDEDALRNRQIAQGLTRDDIVRAVNETEGSITGYLEMSEADPR